MRKVMDVQWVDICGVSSGLVVIVWWQYAWSLQAFLFPDDFFNFALARGFSFPGCLSAILLVKLALRPVWIGCYTIMQHLFNLNAVAYHALTLILHVLNGLQVYVLTRQLTSSRFASLVSCSVVAYQISVVDIFGNFSNLSGMLVALFCWRVMIWYIESRGAWGWKQYATWWVFLLALGSNESAVVLPVILTCYELLWFSKKEGTLLGRAVKEMARRLWFYYLAAGVFFVQQLMLQLFIHREGSYTCVFSVQSWCNGMIFFLREWYGSWPAWLLVGLSVAAVVLAILMKNRVLMLAWCYVLVTFLPFVFLVHHLASFYWYLPQFGMALYTGQLLQSIRVRLPGNQAGSWRARLVHGVVSIGLLSMPFSIASWTSQSKLMHVRNYYMSLSGEYRGFIQQMRELCSVLPSWSCLVFNQTPPLLDSRALTSLLRTVYHKDALWAFVEPDAMEPSMLLQRATIMRFDYRDGRLISE